MNPLAQEVLDLLEQSIAIKKIRLELEQELKEISQKIEARNKFMEIQRKNSQLTPEGIIINGGFYEQ
jgi:hypothetical protein